MKSIVLDMTTRLHSLEYDAYYYDKPVLSRDICMNRCRKRQFRLYTHAAEIVDYLKGLITFVWPSDMAKGINIFEQYLRDKFPFQQQVQQVQQQQGPETEDGSRIEIQIVKKAINKSDYKGFFSGISFNVLIYDRRTYQSIIGQIDFVLDWMIEAEQV